jgi:hypothetical protein
MDQYLTIVEHKEYAKRMDDEHARQNHRINELEKGLTQNNKLLISVEKIALSVENMQKELNEQGDRIEAMEARDGETWREVVKSAILLVVGALVGFVFKQIGL